MDWKRILGPIGLLLVAALNAVGLLDDIVGLRDNMGTAWEFIQTPLGNLALIVTGLGWLAFQVLKPVEKVPTLNELHKQVVQLSKDIEVLNQVRESFYIYLYEGTAFDWATEEGGTLKVSESPVRPSLKDYPYLRAYASIDLTANPSAFIERIEMEIMGRRCSTHWRSHEWVGSMGTGVPFDVPEWVTPGAHPVKAVVLVGEVEFKSNEVIMEFPKQ